MGKILCLDPKKYKISGQIDSKTTSDQHGTYMRKSCLQTLEAKMV